MNIWKRIGYGLLAFVPFIGTLILQIGVTMLTGVFIAVWMMLRNGGGQGMLYYIAQAGTFMLEHYMETIIVTQVVTLLVFGLWYYLAFVRKKEKTSPKSIFSAKNLAAFVLIGLAAYLFINVYLESLYWLLPDAMQAYEELMELSGVGGLTFVSTIATVALAPLGEEILFRGLTYRYFRKAGACFLIANVLQALLFGILHLNFVQGSYAFLLGIFLGYMGRRYHSILVPMFLHMVFNFCGTYIATALDLLPHSISKNMGMLIPAVLLAAAAFKLMGKKQTSVTDACGTSAPSIECTDTEALQSDRESK